jgi:predicted ester cyclase
LGVPPTGKRVTIDVTDILYVDEWRITNHWTVVDQSGPMRQVGIIPEPE